MVGMALQQPLLKSLLPTDAGFYPRAYGHKCTREAGCPETVFIYCVRGDGWCEIGGPRHAVTRDQLVVIPANHPHAYGAAGKRPWTIHWFHAVGNDVPFYLERLGATADHPVLSLGGDLRLFSLFEDVLEDLEHGLTVRHLVYAAHSLRHLMGVILRQKDEFARGGISAGQRAAKSIQFMKEHLREPLRIEALASAVNLSRSHYTAFFRRITGFTPMRYLNHLRLKRAVQLLNTTDLSIKEISDQLGFSDQFYFSRAFRRLYNHAPSEQRRRYGEHPHTHPDLSSLSAKKTFPRPHSA